MPRLLLVLLAACATAPGPTPPPQPTATPIRGWALSKRCDTDWMQPATWCGARVQDYDGCRWRCVWPPIEGARQ